MFRALTPFVFLLSAAASSTVFAEPNWGGGLGYEARMQREVNPDYAETKGLPQVFAQLRFVNWGAHLEATMEEQNSETGVLKISSKTLGVGGWARYLFLQQKRWRPFATLGVGSFFDRVHSEFGWVTNESRGTRPFLGTGGGLSAVFWEHMLFEAECRGTMVRDRKEPMFSALLRIGFVF